MTYRILAALWYLGVFVSVALVAGVFAIVGSSHHSSRISELAATPDQHGMIVHATYVVDKSQLFPEGSHWWVVEELASLFPIVMPVAIFAVVLMLIGYWGIRNHRPA